MYKIHGKSAKDAREYLIDFLAQIDKERCERHIQRVQALSEARANATKIHETSVNESHDSTRMRAVLSP